jgi:hypothetical protein
MIVGTAAQAAKDKFRVDSHGAGAWIHPYFGTGAKAMPAGKPQAGAPLPMLYLVEQDANTTIPAHFHQVTQFQVAVAGGGTLGERDLRPVTVHYTNAFTGYGPLHASGEGLSYFTVRNAFDPGLRPLPEAKQELLDARQTPAGRQPLNIVAEPVAVSTHIEQSTQQSLLAHENGAGALMHRLPQAAEFHAKGLPQDRVWLLISGRARVDGVEVGAMDGVFVPAGASLALQALAQLNVLELRFPG